MAFRNQINLSFNDGKVTAKFHLTPAVPNIDRYVGKRFIRNNCIDVVQDWCDRHKDEFLPYDNGENYKVPESKETIDELDEILQTFGFRLRRDPFWWCMLKGGETAIIVEA